MKEKTEHRRHEPPLSVQKLDNHLMKELKKLAAETHRTLTAIIGDALREALARRHQRVQRPPVSLPTFKGLGLQQGVDLDHTASLLDLMDQKHDAS